MLSLSNHTHTCIMFKLRVCHILPGVLNVDFQPRNVERNKKKSYKKQAKLFLPCWDGGFSSDQVPGLSKDTHRLQFPRRRSIDQAGLSEVQTCLLSSLSRCTQPHTYRHGRHRSCLKAILVSPLRMRRNAAARKHSWSLRNLPPNNTSRGGNSWWIYQDCEVVSQFSTMHMYLEIIDNFIVKLQTNVLTHLTTRVGD